MTITVESKDCSLASISFEKGPVKFTIALIGTLKGTVEVGASEDPKAGSTAITPAGLAEGGLVEQIAHTWYGSTGIKFLGIDATLVETKVTGQAKVADGIEFSVAVEGKLSGGAAVEGKITILKIEGGFKPTVGALELKGSLPPFDVSTTIGAAKFTGGIVVALSGKLEPSPTGIALMVGEDVGGGTAAGTAGRVAVAFVSIDAAIVGGFILGGIGAIAGVASAFAEVDEVQGLGKVVVETTKSLTAGYLAGVSGGGAPGDKAGQIAFGSGQQVRGQIVADAKAKNPDATDDDINAAIKDWASKNAGSVESKMKASVTGPLWDSYGKAYKTSIFDSPDGKKLYYAYLNIFGFEPGESDPVFRRYAKPGWYGTKEYWDEQRKS